MNPIGTFLIGMGAGFILGVLATLILTSERIYSDSAKLRDEESERLKD